MLRPSRKNGLRGFFVLSLLPGAISPFVAFRKGQDNSNDGINEIIDDAGERSTILKARNLNWEKEQVFNGEMDAKERFTRNPYEVLRQMSEAECLCDYEIARLLDVTKYRVGSLRRKFGIKKGNGFFRRFDRSYGVGAVDSLKRMIEDPHTSLSDVARNFGFTREYARQIYKKIYGHPYTEAYKKKLLERKRRRCLERKISQGGAFVREIKRKIESLGLPYRVARNGQKYRIQVNGYALVLRRALKTRSVCGRKYFHFYIAGCAKEDYDFLICLCRNGLEASYYVIPHDVLPKSDISISPKEEGNSRYAMYREAWHLLISKEADGARCGNE